MIYKIRLHVQSLIKVYVALIFGSFFIIGADFVNAQNIKKVAQSTPGGKVVGSWDLTVSTPNGSYPAWLEIEKSGLSTLVGRYVGQGGSARPISEIILNLDEEYYHFSIPPQWSDRNNDLNFEFKVVNNKIKGWTTEHAGQILHFSGIRAPKLKSQKEPNWASPIHLLKNSNLDGWHVIGGKNQWTVDNGILKNRTSGGNLVTDKEFNDFKLHIEFKYPERSNSGIYLRGRYEVQVIDSFGEEPDSHLLGGIYGFLDPTVNAAKKAGKWQSYDITLVGRRVTVVLNGTNVICDRNIPGITGGALDSNEGEAGPIMLQGDHGPIQYKNIVITPMKD